MTESKHTPTPWRVDPKNSGDVQSEDGSVEICETWDQLRADLAGFGYLRHCDETTADANAAFIVKAVNNHGALVAMVRELRQLVRVTGPLTTARERADKLLASLE